MGPHLHVIRPGYDPVFARHAQAGFLSGLVSGTLHHLGIDQHQRAVSDVDYDDLL
jgi:hypothetical protein